MTFTEYENSLQNFHFHEADLGVFFSFLGLSNTVGELSKKIQTTLNSDYQFTEKDKQRLLLSIGDAIYWATNMIIDMGESTEDTIELNLKKLNLKKQKMIEQQLIKNVQDE